MSTESAPEGQAVCMPCRGTGRLLSSLGGTQHEVRCPWCGGSGERIAGIDAQEHPAEGGGGPEPTPPDDREGG